MRSRLVPLLIVAATAAVLARIGSPAATPVATPAAAPTTAATAWAIRVPIPGQAPVSTAVVSDSGSSAAGAFAYPADGSVVSASETTATATTAVQRFASARAQAGVTGLSLFGGEVKADAVIARASAGTGLSGAGGNQLGSAVTNLVALGQPVAGTTAPLGDWGVLTLDAVTVDNSAPAGAKGYQGQVLELDVRLTAAHGGLPAGSEIQVGFAQAAVQTAAKAPPVTTTPVSPPPTGPSTGAGAQTVPQAVPSGPLVIQPPLGPGAYVFPVFGPAAYRDTFGAARAGGSHHTGDDIFGTLGQPLVAVEAGTVFSVGYDKVAGNSLWLLDAQGNLFLYAHLSAFSNAARNGSQVRAGEVIGFMGNTGDAAQTPVHLHFEVHPVSQLYLGLAGAVDPTKYLDGWTHEKSLPYPIAPAWAPNVKGVAAGPEPGAILLGMNDISSADGLDPASLRRSLRPAASVGLGPGSQPGPATAPPGDLGATHGPGT